MIFAKVDVTLPRHHRFLRVPANLRAASMGVWMAALCYSRGQELDGFCPWEELGSFTSKQVLDWLVKVGLFSLEDRDGEHGVIVLKYADHNETKAQIDARRAADRSRKKGRGIQPVPSGILPDSNGIPTGIRLDSDRIPLGTHPVVTVGFPGSDSDSDSPSGSASVFSSDRDFKGSLSAGGAANGTDDGAFGETVSAWADGIRLATGRPMSTPPPGNERRKLVSCIVEHCPKVADRVDWARDAGRAYGSAAETADQLLNVHVFTDWQNSKRRFRRVASGPRPPATNPIPMKRAWTAGKAEIDGK